MSDTSSPTGNGARATRRRMARALGAAGVLGTLALAVAAFAPRMALMTEKVKALWFDVPAPHPVLPTQARAMPPAPGASAAESPQAATANAVEPPAAPAVDPPAAPAPATPEPPPAPQVTATAAERASVPRRARQEPVLTPREIERRKQRYELWLKHQGLERIH